MLMNRISKDWINAFILTLLIFGVLLSLFGSYRFIDASLRLEHNLAYQISSSGEAISPESNAEAQRLIAANVERGDLAQQRVDGMIVGGLGLILLAVGWIAFDIVRSRKKHAEIAVPDRRL